MSKEEIHYMQYIIDELMDEVERSRQGRREQMSGKICIYSPPSRTVF